MEFSIKVAFTWTLILLLNGPAVYGLECYKFKCERTEEGTCQSLEQKKVTCESVHDVCYQQVRVSRRDVIKSGCVSIYESHPENCTLFKNTHICFCESDLCNSNETPMLPEDEDNSSMESASDEEETTLAPQPQPFESGESSRVVSDVIQGANVQSNSDDGGILLPIPKKVREFTKGIKDKAKSFVNRARGFRNETLTCNQCSGKATDPLSKFLCVIKSVICAPEQICSQLLTPKGHVLSAGCDNTKTVGCREVPARSTLLRKMLNVRKCSCDESDCNDEPLWTPGESDSAEDSASTSVDSESASASKEIEETKDGSSEESTTIKPVEISQTTEGAPSSKSSEEIPIESIVNRD